jgi:hypothetical protein
MECIESRRVCEVVSHQYDRLDSRERNWLSERIGHVFVFQGIFWISRLSSQSIFFVELLGAEVHEMISFIRHPGRRHSGVSPRLVDRSLIQRFMYAEPADTLMSVS